MKQFLLVGILCAVAPSLYAQAEPLVRPHENHVKSRLIADTDSIEPGQVFRLGVVFAIEEHAHIYWRNPGSSGFATEVRWELPEGFAVGPLQWPSPSRFEIVEIEDISYGYQTQSLLFSGVRAGTGLNAGDTVRLSVDTRWLVCQESGQCIPEMATLHLDLRVGKSGPSADSALFDTYTRRLPVNLREETPIFIERSAGAPPQIVVTARGPWKIATGEHARRPLFFPNQGEAWHAVTSDEAEVVKSMTFKAIDTEADPTIGGVLEVSVKSGETGPERSLYIEIPSR